MKRRSIELHLHFPLSPEGEEYRAAIEWLNGHTDDEVGFFLCGIHLYRIEGSRPAVKFVVIEKPNDWARAVRKMVH